MKSCFVFSNWLLVSISLSIIVVGVQCHNWLDTPVSRNNQRQSQTGCRVGGEGSPDCPGPCDISVSGITIAAVPASRGESLQILWNRHTHPGGFIRFAWSPTSESDSQSSFDNRVDRIVCKEIGGCGPSDPTQPDETTNGLLCNTTVKVPEWVTDGEWTLQWAYFGGWYNAGDYYACVDYTISGGPSSNVQPAPVFIGGDYTYPNEDVCLFYSTNALHVCVIEPCTTGTFPVGNQVGPAAGFSSSPSPSPSPSPVTTGAASTGQITTGKHVVTTSKITTAHPPLTTGVTTQHAVTTGVTTQHAVTTGHPSVTTGHPSVTTGHPSVTTGITTHRAVTTGHPSVTTSHQAVTTGAHSTGHHAVTTGSKKATTGSKKVTTGSMKKLTTGSQDDAITTGPSSLNGVTTSDADALCYLPGTPLLDGPINTNPPTCGSNSSPAARCEEGLCCSQFGYCGPIPDSNGRYYEDVHGRYTHVTAEYAFSLYCNNQTQADYRKVACTSIDGNGDDDLNKDAGSGTLLHIQMELVLLSILTYWMLS